MTIFRVIGVFLALVGAVYLSSDYEALPELYPHLFGSLPSWLFKQMTLIAVILFCAYLWAECRNIKKWRDLLWLDEASAAQKIYDGLSDLGEFSGGRATGSIFDRFPEYRYHFVQGVNDSILVGRGKRDGRSVRDALPQDIFVKDLAISEVLSHPPPEDVITDPRGHVWEELSFKRNSIDRYLRHVKRHDYQLKGGAAKG